MTARKIAFCAVIASTLFIAKLVLSSVAGIEIVTLLIFVFCSVFGLQTTLVGVFGFICIDTCLFGAQIWTVMYLLHFPFVAICAYMCRNSNDYVKATVSAVVTILFGLQTTLLEHFVLGVDFSARYILGLPVFILNAASNFVLVLIACPPLSRLLSKSIKLK